MKAILKRLGVFICLMAIIHPSYSQFAIINRSGALLLPYEKQAFLSGKNIHTSSLPYLVSDFGKIVSDSIDSANGFPKAYDKALNWFLSKPFGQKKYPNANLYISPVIEMGITLGLKGGSKMNYELAGGLNLTGNIGNKFSFSFLGLGMKGKYPTYISNYINQNKVIPGIGYAYGSGSTFSTFNFSGYIAYQPSRYFSASLGNGKHFVGDGYRSLLLSYNSNNFNYLKLDANFWKLKYWVLYSRMSDIEGSGGNIGKFTTKFSTTHYLDVLLGKHASFGLFESVVWTNKNMDGTTRGFDLQYINPFIFIRPVEYSLGSPDNVLLGANLRVRVLKRQVLYVQIMLDEFLLKEVLSRNGWWANKQGFQLGLKGYDLLGIKGLFYQGELNYVRPYSYTHYQITQNYANFGQPLAHPYGANFVEGIGRIMYQFKQHGVEAKIIYAIIGTDSDTVNYGSDVFKPYTSRPTEYGNNVGQGIRNNLVFAELKYTFLINRRWNLMFETGVIVRFNQTIQSKDNQTYFNLGFKTTLPYKYTDF